MKTSFAYRVNVSLSIFMLLCCLSSCCKNERTCPSYIYSKVDIDLCIDIPSEGRTDLLTVLVSATDNEELQSMLDYAEEYISVDKTN